MWNNWHNFFIFAILQGIKFFCMLRWSYFANYHVCRRGQSFEWEKLTNGLFFALFSKQNGNKWQKYRIIWVFRAWYLHNLMFSFNFAIEIVVECHWFADEIVEVIIFWTMKMQWYIILDKSCPGTRASSPTIVRPPAITPQPGNRP